MKRYFEALSQGREVRPTATSLDTYRDIIYLEPVICWDVSRPGRAANQWTGPGHVIVEARELFAPFWAVFNVSGVITSATMQLWRL